MAPSRAGLLARARATIVHQGHSAVRSCKGPVPELTLVYHATDPRGTHGRSRDCDHSSSPTVRGSTTRPVGTGDLPESTVRTLCCDPVLRTVVLDALGNPVDLGRSTRLAPPALRRALEVRDGGCVFPGCDAPPAWCDLHHVVHWADGGTTSADNLASLCRHHHGVTHRNGWTMTTDPHHEQRFTWTRPDHTVLHSQRANDHDQANYGSQDCGSTDHGPPGTAKE